MNPALSDPRAEEVLVLFAEEARIDRALLHTDARPDELGLSSLDIALALFELEDRFDIDLPALVPGAPQPTVGELVEQVLQCMDRRGDAATATPTLNAP